jgi:hypothetical protein
MITWILLAALVVIIVVFVIVVANLPGDFCVTRTIAISAPAAAAFARVNDFHQWPSWSPWEELDPKLERIYDGPKSGVDAQYAWKGTGAVGAGRMRIAQSEEPRLIRIELHFERPSKATNLCEFTFNARGNLTVVSWSMSGKSHGAGKVVGLFGLRDKLLGGMFDRGLEKMKKVCESA